MKHQYERTQNRTYAYLLTVLFLVWVDIRICFICTIFFFFKALLDAVFPVTAMQKFDLKKKTVSWLLFFVMNLNLYLTSERSQSKKRC